MIKINIIFNDKKAVKSISLIYTAIFPTEKDAYATEAVSHAFFNKSLEASGYSASKFSNKYARYDNKLILSLTANGNEIDSFSAPFFMIKTKVFTLKNLYFLLKVVFTGLLSFF